VAIDFMYSPCNSSIKNYIEIFDIVYKGMAMERGAQI
jgi:hypothetical protein